MVAKAAILCGGQGTRLRPLTDYFQKTMIPIGLSRRPLLEYVVRLMVFNGIRDIVLLCGYRSHEIENYFGDGARFGAKISYSQDTVKAKGSAHSLMRAIETGATGKFDYLVVYYGDVLSTLDVAALLNKLRDADADAALVLSKQYQVPVGVASVRNGHVERFEEKPTLDLKVTTGCLALSKKCVPILRATTRAGGSVDIMTHFVPKLLAAGVKVVPFYLRGFWYDVGTTEAYEKLDHRALEERLAFLG